MPTGRERGPLGPLGEPAAAGRPRLIGPIARGQEARADRSAAAIAGGGAAASALVKVALVQPLFREVLDHYDPDRPRRPQPLRLLPCLLVSPARRGPHGDAAPGPRQQHRPRDSAHPPLPDRLALLQTYPDPADSSHGDASSRHHLARRPRSLRADAPQPPLRPSAVEPSVFHKAGS